MYRLVIYYLTSLLILAAILSFFGVLPYNPWHILFSALYLVAVCYAFNSILSKVIKIGANAESAFITGLILALIVGPDNPLNQIGFLTFVAAAAMLSKYVLVWKGKHIFNPAAVAAVIAGFAINQGASWWAGNTYLTPFVIIGGLILVRKIGRGRMIISFLLVYFAWIFLTTFGDLGSATLGFIWQLALASPVVFFAFVMLTEPQTSPKRDLHRIIYGLFTAAALIIYQTYLPVGYTLELALLTGNFFAFLTARDVRAGLALKESRELGSQIRGFWFDPDRKINFSPGQFLEWTSYHPSADSRGIRRYFSIASSPTENTILLAAKFPAEPSSFKRSLLKLQPQEKIVATGAEGEFILPESRDKKLAFVAGGIGITPFRSMIKYLLDKNLSRDIILFYSANTPAEFVFQDIFQDAKNKFGLKTVYTISDKSKVSSDWQGETGFIDAEMVKRQVPDWQERLFYISGPEPMVRAMAKTLAQMSVTNIKVDYFPGYEEI